jgi:hypothetical protein
LLSKHGGLPAGERHSRSDLLGFVNVAKLMEVLSTFCRRFPNGHGIHQTLVVMLATLGLPSLNGVQPAILSGSVVDVVPQVRWMLADVDLVGPFAFGQGFGSFLEIGPCPVIGRVGQLGSIEHVLVVEHIEAALWLYGRPYSWPFTIGRHYAFAESIEQVESVLGEHTFRAA